MLGIVLLQYAKFLKKIQVKGIYYGAFEKLGTASEVEKKYPYPKDRIAPVLNLTNFSVLQDWATAGHSFVNLGNADMLTEITAKELIPISTNSLQPKRVRTLKEISESVQRIAIDFRTNRGTKIIAADEILHARDKIEKLEVNIIKPFTPILEKLKADISLFQANDCNNIFYGVQWCIDKKLIQEGLTILQEGMITMTCYNINEDYQKKELRGIISSYLNVWYKEKDKWNDNLKTEAAKKIITKIEEYDNQKTIRKLYGKITEIRNDINHGGFVKEPKQGKFFIDTLEEYFQEAKNIFYAH
jgi:hypothetical protein